MRKIKQTALALTVFVLIAGMWHYGIGGGAAKYGLRGTGAGAVSDSAKFKNIAGEGFNRSLIPIDYSALSFVPWDVKAASVNVEERGKKPYTIMIYMNGSDLESEDGAATDDLIEMLESGVKAENANVILLTGGTNRWQNDVIPPDECAIWEITGGEIVKLAGIGLVNMGDAGTLSSFVDFAVTNFPADKFGLIMWDHGGGSIAGYGHDEKFENGNLTLLDMDYAFGKSKLKNKKLEFLGFDSCLMASVEMAVIASEYAEYLIASEDLEPSGGWDYSFLRELNKEPDMSGLSLGVAVTDYFMNYYDGSQEILTLSVVDLSNVGGVMSAMGKLMDRCTNGLMSEREEAFKTLAKRRNGTKTFGEGSPRDNDCDMVDIGDMASKLSDLFPAEAANVAEELNKSVKYNRHNSNANLMGLSAYYIYGGKEAGNYSLETYADLNMSGEYTGYLNSFYNMLKSGTPQNSTRNRSAVQGGSDNEAFIKPEEVLSKELTTWIPLNNEASEFIMTGKIDGANTDSDETLKEGMATALPMIAGKYVCLYKINSTEGFSLYSVPSVRNGEDCDLIVLFDEKNPQGKILGIRKEDGIIIQKGFDELKHGDVISFYTESIAFSGDGREEAGWHESEEIIVDSGLKIEWKDGSDKGVIYMLLVTDIWNNRYFEMYSESTFFQY